MPQLDPASFFNQVLWLSLSFFLLLPFITATLCTRHAQLRAFRSMFNRPQLSPAKYASPNSIPRLKVKPKGFSTNDRLGWSTDMPLLREFRASVCASAIG